MTTTNDLPLTDLGPAPQAPAWCAAGTLPNTESHSTDGYLWSWYRNLSEDVWIEADDRIVDGRIARTETRIQYSEPPRDGITVDQARELAAALVAAADIITTAAMAEAAQS